MGGANIICSDKTGTLTKNQMECTNMWNGIDQIIFDDVTNSLVNYTHYAKDQQSQELFLNAIILNSTEDPSKTLGNPTEMAILKYLQKCGVDVVQYRAKHEKMFEASFSSDRKRMSTVIRMPNGKLFVYMKGASEYTIELCKDWLDFESGSLKPKTAETQAVI